MTPRHWIFLLALLHASLTLAQTPTATLTGSVRDGRTGQPLPFATVYLNMSTRGTQADSLGRYTLAGVPLGTHELVASSLGYAPARQTLRLSVAREHTVDLRPDPVGSDLAAVTVTARRSGPWLRRFRRFSRELFGDRPFASQTRIMNAEVLSFDEEKGHFRAEASQPLVVENRALGYRIHYTLLHFDLYRGRLVFAGDSRFEELEPRDARQRAAWQANRMKAYRGSLHHLMASLLAGTHEEEGFLVSQSPLLGDGSAGGALPIPLVRTQERRFLSAPQATALFRPGDLPFERRLVSPVPLEVFYRRIFARNAPYADVPYAYSLLLIPNQAVDLTAQGWVTRGRGLDVRGYLGNDRLATLLPADWVPPTKQGLESTDVLAGRTLRPDARLDSLEHERQRQARASAPHVFVHTDKPRYGTGDRVWFSVYVLEAARQVPVSGPVNQTLHVALIEPGGRPVLHQWLQLTNGRAAGDVRLSDTLAAGTYRLRAYTNQEQPPGGGPPFEVPLVVYNPRRPLPEPSHPAAGVPVDSLDIQFLPEGGRWLVNRPARLGIRAVRASGRGQAVAGGIVDEAGTEVARFRTDARGLGRVSLTPQRGRRYTARVEGLPPISLPEADTQGWTLAADAVVDSARIAVTAWATGLYRDQPVYVTLQCREEWVYRQKWQLSKGEVRFSIPTETLPPGVARLTLWDDTGRPRAERLVFVPDATGPVQVRISTAQATFAPREQVALGLLFRDADNYPVGADWSAAVVDADQVPPDSSQTDMRTHLLLTSALKGRVEAPAYYLDPGHAEDLDNLLLTQGWRRLPAPVPADSVGGWALQGQVRDHRGRLLADETVLLRLETGGQSLQRQLTTDSTGTFRLTGLLLADTVRVRASTPRTRATTIRFAEPGYPFPASPAPVPDWRALAPWAAETARRQAEWPALYRDTTARLLGEVVVRGAKPIDRDQRPVEVERASLHGTPDSFLVVEGNESMAILPDIISMIRRLPGVMVNSSTIRVRGAIDIDSGRFSPPLFIVDGVYVDQEIALGLDPRQVSRIELLKNAGSASMYGARAAGGVIAIFTRKGSNAVIPEPAGPSTLLVGFVTPREYYVPRYPQRGPDAPLDRRDVLHWQPLGQSDPDGMGRLLVPLNDTAKRLRVLIQGITTEGVPIFCSWELPVR
jgi:hypothetical protein